MRDLTDLASEITEAIELLKHASRMAYEISGADGGRQGDPEHGIPEIPEVEGWPAMENLSGELDALARKVDSAFTQEIREACEEARKEEMDAPEPIQEGDYHYYQAH